MNPACHAGAAGCSTWVDSFFVGKRRVSGSSSEEESPEPSLLKAALPFGGGLVSRESLVSGDKTASADCPASLADGKPGDGKAGGGKAGGGKPGGGAKAPVATEGVPTERCCLKKLLACSTHPLAAFALGPPIPTLGPVLFPRAIGVSRQDSCGVEHPAHELAHIMACQLAPWCKVHNGTKSGTQPSAFTRQLIGQSAV